MCYRNSYYHHHRANPEALLSIITLQPESYKVNYIIIKIRSLDDKGQKNNSNVFQRDNPSLRDKTFHIGVHYNIKFEFEYY